MVCYIIFFYYHIKYIFKSYYSNKIYFLYYLFIENFYISFYLPFFFFFLFPFPPSLFSFCLRKRIKFQVYNSFIFNWNIYMAYKSNKLFTNDTMRHNHHSQSLGNHHPGCRMQGISILDDHLDPVTLISR